MNCHLNYIYALITWMNKLMEIYTVNSFSSVTASTWQLKTLGTS